MLIAERPAAQASSNDVFDIPASFKSNKKNDITIFNASKHIFVKSLNYGKFSDQEVVVGSTSDSSQLIVGYDDGSFRLVASKSVQIDREATARLHQALEQSHYQSLSVSGPTTFKISESYPLNDLGIAACTNIPPVVHVAAGSTSIGFALLVKSTDNERCGPDYPYNSHFETFGLYMSDPVAVSPNRIFFRVETAIISIPYDKELNKIAVKACKFMLPEKDYVSLVKRAATHASHFDDLEMELHVEDIEAEIEKMLITRSAKDGCGHS